MSTLREAAEQAGAQEVPLIERLERVPKHARHIETDADGLGSSSYPVGVLCHEAAAALRAALAAEQKQSGPKSGHSADLRVNPADGQDYGHLAGDKPAPTEPVAWRWRERISLGWNYATHREWIDPKVDAEPLYAHPQPAPSEPLQCECGRVWSQQAGYGWCVCADTEPVSGEPTDEMVEAACQQMWQEYGYGDGDWHAMRAVLVAALKARGDGR